MRRATCLSSFPLIFVSLLIATSMFGCKKARMDAESLLASADSAAREAWGTASDKISKVHSPTYDSLSTYYRRAAKIEAERVSLEDTLDHFARRVLGSAEIESDTVRANTEQLFHQFSRSLDSLDDVADTIRLACAAYFERLQKELKLLDRAVVERAKAVVLAPEKFGPIWRPRYDSLQSEASRLFLAMLGVFDSARGAVMVDSSSGRIYRFRDLSLTSRFNAYLDSLSRIGALQSASREASTYARKP